MHLYRKSALPIGNSSTVCGSVGIDEQTSYLYVYLDVIVFWRSRGWGCWRTSRREQLFSTVQLFNSVAHLISPAFGSLASGDLSFPLSVTNLTTNCSSPMYWNKRVKFSTSGTVLEWDSHMLIISFPLVSYISMQFSDCHAGHLETGLRLRNPGILYPFSISDRTPLPLFHIRPVPLPGPPFLHPVHPVETVLYKYFRCGNHGIILHPVMGTDE